MEDGPTLARRAAAMTATVRVRGFDPRGDIARAASYFVCSSAPTSGSGEGSVPMVTSLSATALRLPPPPSPDHVLGVRPPVAASTSSAFSVSSARRSSTMGYEHLIAPLSLFLPFLMDAQPDEKAVVVAGVSDGGGSGGGGIHGDGGGGGCKAQVSPMVPGTEVHVLRPSDGGGGGREDNEGNGCGGGWVLAKVVAVVGREPPHRWSLPSAVPGAQRQQSRLHVSLLLPHWRQSGHDV